MKWIPQKSEQAKSTGHPQPSATDGAPRYRVMVDDNFHHMDVEERYEYGTFATCAEAIAACRRIVDGFLLDQYKPPMTADELWRLYTAFGDDAFIITTDRACSFSGWEYARARCEEIAGD